MTLAEPLTEWAQRVPREESNDAGDRARLGLVVGAEEVPILAVVRLQMENTRGEKRLLGTST